MAHDKRDHGDGGIDERGKDRWRLGYRVGGKRLAAIAMPDMAKRPLAKG
jgi:hypothetical protein